MSKIEKHTKLCIIAAAMLVAAVPTTRLSARQPQSSAEVKRQSRKTQREIQQTKYEISKNEAAVAEGLSRLSQIEGEINECKKVVSDMNSQVKRLDSEIGSLNQKISSDEKKLQLMRSEYLKAVKKMRLAKGRHSTLAFIFSAKTFNQGVRRLRYVREFSRWREKQSRKIGKQVESLKSSQNKLSATRSEKRKALDNSRRAQSTMESRHKEQDKVVAQLKQHGAELQAHLERKQREADMLNAQISELIAKEEAARAEREAKAKAEREAKAKAEREAKAKAEREAKAKAEREAKAEAERVAKAKAEREAKAKAEKKQAEKPKAEPKKERARTPEKSEDLRCSSNTDYAKARGRKPRQESATQTKQPKPQPEKQKETKVDNHVESAAGFGSTKGRLPNPVSGSFKIVSKFGRHPLPNLPKVQYDNPGIDAEVSAGASAKAVYPGRVSGVYMLPGYHNVVIINHGDYYTVYGNIASPSVKVGDNVAQGQSLGSLAPDPDRGNRTIIHFEVWHNRMKLNPEEWIR